MLSIYQVISLELYTIYYISCNYNDWASLQVVRTISYTYKKYINSMSPWKKKTTCMGSSILCKLYLNKAFLKKKRELKIPHWIALAPLFQISRPGIRESISLHKYSTLLIALALRYALRSGKFQLCFFFSFSVLLLLF